MSNMLKAFEDHERKVLTFDLYDCLLNFRLVPHFVGQIGRENNILSVRSAVKTTSFLSW